MSVTAKNKKSATTAIGSKRTSSKKFPRITVSNKVGNYEKHPFFVKKANDAKELLERVGAPKFITKSK